MKTLRKHWGLALCVVLALVGLFVAVKVRVQMAQPGAYAVGGDINGMPVSEIIGYIAALGGAIGTAVSLYRKNAGASLAESAAVAQATEESHLAALNGMYFSESDWEAADKLKALRVHRTRRTKTLATADLVDAVIVPESTDSKPGA